ncbi:hypothetical protein AYO49_05125, partial [Verrucomicrobiaceae bacterium SCGC AG-212-N21]
MNLGSMSDKERHLWQCISSFPIDAPDALKDFSARLREENGWTGAFAKRAVEEYRRFIYLSQVAGHPVSPSEEVDQVWHLHLIYTKSYWQGLCEVVLGGPFHHEPSRGGVGESAKYREMYAQTLQTYERVFGEEPPEDWWPPVEKRFALHQARWVDVSRHWVVPRPAFLGRSRRWLERLGLRRTVAGFATVALVINTMGCTEAANIFGMRGPEFLLFYLWALPSALLLSLVFAWVMRGGIGRAPLGEEVDAYDAAFLGGGGGRAVSAALASLYGRGLIQFGESWFKATVQQTDRAPQTLHEMEWLVYKAVPQRVAEDLTVVRESLEPRMERLREKLVERGWLLGPEEVTRIKWIAALPFVALLLVGALKLVLGVDRDKPVLFLFLLLIVTLVILAVRLASLCKRTAEGQAVWRNLRAARHRLQDQLRHSSVADTTAAMPMAVALLGTGAFATPG